MLTVGFLEMFEVRILVSKMIGLHEHICKHKIHIDIYVFTDRLHGLEITQGNFVERSLRGLNFFYQKAKESSLLYHLPIAGGRIIGFIPFPRVSAQCDMQAASSRI